MESTQNQSTQEINLLHVMHAHSLVLVHLQRQSSESEWHRWHASWRDMLGVHCYVMAVVDLRRMRLKSERLAHNFSAPIFCCFPPMREAWKLSLGMNGPSDFWGYLQAFLEQVTNESTNTEWYCSTPGLPAEAKLLWLRHGSGRFVKDEADKWKTCSWLLNSNFLIYGACAPQQLDFVSSDFWGQL